MRTVRYTGHGRYRVAGVTFEHGDTATVDADHAAHLTDTAPFEEVIDAEGGVREEDGPPDDVCGYYDPETMASPCRRDAGWGRDADTGHCSDHHDA